MDPVGTPPSDFVGGWRHLVNELTIAVRVLALLQLAAGVTWFTRNDVLTP
jgi:hypothetical protein